MNTRVQELAEQAHAYADSLAVYEPENSQLFEQKFAELIIQEYAKKTIQGLMSDPAFIQAMDEYYENKWAHRFD